MAPLFTLYCRKSGQSWEPVPVTGFPFVVGRSPEASFRLVAPGVYDEHLRFELRPDEGLVVSAGQGALASVGGELLQSRRLRQGEEITFGPFTVRVLLGPPERRSLRVWEVLLWVTLGAVLALQVYLIQDLFRLGL